MPFSVPVTAGTAARAEQAGDIMNAAGTVPADRMWARIGDMPAGRKSDPGGPAADSRLLPEAVLWRFRTGSPWRDLPERSGNWNSVSRRFRRWVLSGVPERIFNASSEGSDLERVSVDGTVVQAHRKAAGAREGGPPARGSAAPGVASYEPSSCQALSA